MNCSTDESVTAYIERTISSFLTPQPEHPISTPEESQPGTAKTSESEKVAVSVEQVSVTAGQFVEEEMGEVHDTRGLYSDSSDAGELIDSSGVDLPTAKSSTFTLDPEVFPEFSDDLHRSSGNSDDEQSLYRAKVATSERKLTASGREAIRKYFSKMYQLLYQQVIQQ